VTVPEGLKPPVRDARSDAEPPRVIAAGVTVELMVGLAFGTVILTVVVAPEAVAPTGLPVTWKLYELAATEDATLTVKPLDPVGVTGLTVKAPQVIPKGRPEQDNVTGIVVPAVNVAVIITEPELPCAILTGPSFDSE